MKGTLTVTTGLSDTALRSPSTGVSSSRTVGFYLLKSSPDKPDCDRGQGAPSPTSLAPGPAVIGRSKPGSGLAGPSSGRDRCSERLSNDASGGAAAGFRRGCNPKGSHELQGPILRERPRRADTEHRRPPALHLRRGTLALGLSVCSLEFRVVTLEA